jgi:flagellar biosynthesis protein FliQ
MKIFFVQAFWIIAITILLNLLIGLGFSIFLPSANHKALGQLMFLPTLIVAVLITIIGTRMGKLPGTKKS